MQNLEYINFIEGILNKESARLFLNIVAIILIIGGAFLFYNRNIIKADSDLGTFKAEKEFNLVLNNKKFRFIIKSYSKNGINKNYLVRSNIFKTKQVELLGFEDDFNLCNKPTLKFKDKEIICLVGDVGVHSQSIAFIGQDLSLVKVDERGIIKYGLTTDVPNYKILDINNDGYDDIVVDNRDYDKNPLADFNRKYYLGKDDAFIFDKEEAVEVK